MKFTRLAAVAATAVLTTTGFMAVNDLAQAAPQHPGHFTVNYPFHLGQSRIQGTVSDQFGNRVDDVSVHASGASGSASQLTYAKGNGIGHGYFNLSVRKATFTVTLRKAGYEDVTIKGVKVGRQDVANLGRIVLTKDLVKTKTTLDKGKCKSKGGRTTCAMTVTVGGKGVKKPTGKITLGGQSYKLKASDGGEWDTTVVLTKTTTLTAKYAGDDKYDGSTSDDVKIKV